MQLPASNSPCSPEERLLHAPSSPNGCHRRMPLLRGLRLITSPVQLSPVQGGRVVITIPALVDAHIGPDMCVRAPPPPLQRGTTKNRQTMDATKQQMARLREAQQTGKPGKPGSEMRRLWWVSPV